MNQKAIKKLEKAIFGERGMESRFKLPVDLIDVLSSKEYLVLSKRFGLDTGITRTLEDVGKDFGVTKERIRQIEAKALDKIKHWSDIETKKVKNTKSALIKKMPNNLYQEFFTQLLKKAQEKTDLHANVRPQRNFCAATRNGLSYSYIVKTRPDGGCGRVELYIFQGDRATNEETYCGFLENKKKIEEIFGNRLNWSDLATKNSPRVAHKSYIIDYIIPKLTFFGEEGKRNWPELQDKMIDAMSRLEKAL